MVEIGNIVVAKEDNRLLGEVIAIDDMDRATVKLCESGVEVLLNISSLYCTGATQPQRESGRTVHILGTEYKILIIEEGDCRYDREADGWVDTSAKEILIFNYKFSIESLKNLVAYQKKVIRHEIVHAFLYESGLWQNSCSSKCWAQNEEMVDWIAIQMPKIQSAYKEAECE